MIRVIVLAGLVALANPLGTVWGGANDLWAAEAVPAPVKPTVVKALDQAPKLDFGKQARIGHPQIHRIKNAAALKQLGGAEGLPVDFESQDLVVVRGSLGCAHGEVEFRADKSTVTFSVRVAKRCTHRTMQLHMFPYASAFAVGKTTRIASSVFVENRRAPRPQGDLAKKLAKKDATHLNLSGCQLNDCDLEKLTGFKDLTHLYLSNNKITDKGLACLSHMTKLYQLYLVGNPDITDVGLGHLSPIMTSRIQILGIEGTSITDEGLKKLQKLSKQQKNQFSTQINHSIVTPKVYE